VTAPSRPAAVRRKRRVPARPTAHVGYQPGGPDLRGRRVRERYHAIADQAVRIAGVNRRCGDALCGSAGPWVDIPDGLFPPSVSCPVCRHLAASEHVAITGSDA